MIFLPKYEVTNLSIIILSHNDHHITFYLRQTSFNQFDENLLMGDPLFNTLFSFFVYYWWSSSKMKYCLFNSNGSAGKSGQGPLSSAGSAKIGEGCCY